MEIKLYLILSYHVILSYQIILSYMPLSLFQAQIAVLLLNPDRPNRFEDKRSMQVQVNCLLITLS